MNFRNLAYSLLIGGIVFGCDSFEDDVVPQGDDLLNLDIERKIQQGNGVFFDLKSSVSASEAVEFHIGLNPQKGSVDFLENAILKYTPNADFVSGVDLFSVELFDINQSLLDVDTLIVEMISDSTDLPCFSGALPEYYVLGVNESIQFNPILNDGFCPENVDEIILRPEDPDHGTVEVVNDIELLYTPDQDYVGYDYFLYEIELVDLEGVSHVSISIVEFEIIDGSQLPCYEEMFPNQDIVLEGDREESYEIQIFYSDPSCDVFAWDVTVTDVINGTAEPNENRTHMIYYPGPDSIGVVHYLVEFSGGFQLERCLNLYFDEDLNGPDTTACPVGIEDFFTFDMGMDSAGFVMDTVYFNPGDNDIKCSDFYQINILEEPDIGEVAVVDDQWIQMVVLEEFAGERTTQLKYEICDDGKCDDEYVYITIFK